MVSTTFGPVRIEPSASRCIRMNDSADTFGGTKKARHERVLLCAAKEYFPGLGNFYTKVCPPFFPNESPWHLLSCAKIPGLPVYGLTIFAKVRGHLAYSTYVCRP